MDGDWHVIVWAGRFILDYSPVGIRVR